jgi:hypothetical protein
MINPCPPNRWQGIALSCDSDLKVMKDMASILSMPSLRSGSLGYRGTNGEEKNASTQCSSYRMLVIFRRPIGFPVCECSVELRSDRLATCDPSSAMKNNSLELISVGKWLFAYM